MTFLLLSSSIFAQTQQDCKLELPTVVSGTEKEGKPANLVAFTCNCLIKKVKVSVYNRWGELVYETTDLNHIWMGKDTPTGVYHLIVSGEYSNGESLNYTGSITYMK